MSCDKLRSLVCCLAIFCAHPSIADTQPPAGNTDADRAAMKARLEGVIDAYNAADPEAFKSAYTEDAWVISMRRPIKSSREEIGAAFTPGMSKYLFRTELNVLDVEVHGDLAGCVIAYSLHKQLEPIPDNTPGLLRPLLELEHLAPGTGYVYVLSTLPKMRGKGVGSSMLRFAE